MCAIRPCKKTLFFGLLLHIIQISLHSGKGPFTCSSSVVLVWFLSACPLTTTPLSFSTSFFVTSSSFFSTSFFINLLCFLGLFASYSSDKLLSEICLLRFFPSSSLTLVEGLSSLGTAIWSRQSRPNSWLEQLLMPESWDDKPLRHDFNSANFTGEWGISLLLSAFLRLLGRGGKNAFRSCGAN